MTPDRTAQFMAGMFSTNRISTCRLLDPGAGIGSLSLAFLERWFDGEFNFNSLQLTAFEIDDLLRKELQKTLSIYEKQLPISSEIMRQRGQALHLTFLLDSCFATDRLTVA